MKLNESSVHFVDSADHSLAEAGDRKMNNLANDLDCGFVPSISP